MNLKLKVLSAAAIFFIGGQAFAQQQTHRKKSDSTKVKDIEEVVVLGYSKKTTVAKSTAASTTISSETLKDRPNISFLNSIQGAAPGISINSSSGSPGSGKINVLIRGISSLNGSKDPLYVIDGLATSGSEFRNLNPNDIETISILRDAQATSIYGNRAASGVVVITTKTGKFNTAFRISYDAMTTFSTYPTTHYDLANAKEFLQIQKNYGAGTGATMTQDQINNFSTDTDWSKQFYQIGMSQQHNLGLQFGGQNLSIYSSLGYTKSDGIVKGTDFQRFTFRNNLVGKSPNGKLNYSANVGIGYSKRNQLDQEENSGIAYNTIQNVLYGGLLSNPTVAPYPFANGLDMYNHIGTSYGSVTPWVLYDNMIGGIKNRYTEASITANENISYKLTDWLTIGNRSGIDFKENDRIYARPPLGYLAQVVAAGAGAAYGGFETMTNTKDFTFNTVTNLTATKTYGDHTFTLGAYVDYLKAHYLYTAQTQNGLNPLNYSFGAGTGYIPFNTATPNLYRPSIGASKIDAGTLAYFGTLDYDYAGKYGIGAIIRRDGSYRFPKENRWETFYSVSGRWNIDKENFMDGSGFRMLKLRGSYGTQGNQNIGTPVNNFNPIFMNPTIYQDIDGTNTGYQNLPGYAISVLGNSNLRWEKVTQANLGLDYNYKNFVEGSIDIYRKRTSRMFNGINLSAVTGQYTITGNNGEMENKGIEAAIRFNLIHKEDAGLSIYANAAYNKNKILSMDHPDLTNDNVNAPGGVAYQWQLYRYVGVNAKTGEQQFLDANGNITESPTAADRVLTGKSYYPKTTGGFGLNANYKGFFADVFFSFQTGGWIWDNLYSWMMDPSYAANGTNVSKALLNAWTPTNTGSNIPSVTANNAGTEGDSDRFLYKSDFLKLKNVSFGYAFTKSQLANLPIHAAKIYAQAENLYTWSSWKGYDPEPITAYSGSVYPLAKTISIGVNVEF